MPATPELITFVRLQLQNGFSPDDIAAQLAVDGWEAIDIQHAFRSVELPEHAATIADIRISTLLVETALMFFKRLWVILILAVVTAFCFASYYFIPSYALSFFVKAFKEQNPWKDIITTGSGASFLLFVMTVFQGWGPMAIFYATLHRGERANPFQALGYAFGKTTRYLTLWFLQYAVCNAILFFFILIALLLGYALHIQNNKHMLAINSTHFTFGFILLIMFLLTEATTLIWFSLSVPILVDEHTRALNALLKSKAYFKRDYWSFIKLLVPKVILQLLLLLLPLAFLIKTQNRTMLLSTISSVFLLLLIFHEIYIGILYDYIKGAKDLSKYKVNMGSRLTLMFVVLLGILLPFATGVVLYYQYGALIFSLISSNPIK